MFADDLIIITSASRKASRNCLLCLNIYQDLTEQKRNLNKSTIFFPSWCNKTIAKSISNIFNIKLGYFPFIYLGIPISPKKLLVNQFNFLTNRVKNTIHAWNHTTISTAARVVLLNSYIFSIPKYYLSIMAIPILSLTISLKWLGLFFGAGQAIGLSLHWLDSYYT